MFSPAHASTYQRYKADTDSVATWLATTAQEHGYITEAAATAAQTAENDTTKKKKKKKNSGKGKGPGHAKALKKPTANLMAQTSSGKYVIEVREFEAMAKYVAEIDAIKIPRRITIALERAIWVRKSFSQQLTKSGASQDSDSDATHNHFISVLERVRDILEPIMEAVHFNPEDTSRPTKDSNPMSNMFDVLNVYTPSEAFLNAPDITPEPTTLTSSRRAKWKQDVTALMEFLADLRFLGTNAGRRIIEDELIRGVHYLYKEPTEYPPLWLCWALQTWLCFMQFLGSNCDLAYKQMKQEGLKIQKALLDVQQSPERTRVLELVTLWNKDPIFSTRQVLTEGGVLKPGNVPAEFTFLRRNFIHCGLLLHHWRCQLHSSGLEFAAHRGGVLVTTQLYHALRNEKRICCGKSWDDLETMWKFQGDSYFFIGEPPKNREGYHKNFYLCLGPRRLFVDDKREPWTPAAVAKLLEDGRVKETQDGNGKTYAHMKGRGNEREPLPTTPTGLIGHLAQVIHDEVPRISFNYFSMHCIVWGLLTDLKQAFLENMGPNILLNIPEERKLPLLVGLIFGAASGHIDHDVRVRKESNDAYIDIATGVVKVV
ncbi:hypothetical protein FLONG3_4333 [Fusarium longipes]|uniref:DUF6604 domain-containing protein n=1 Tax=Fusarium longipes TaxID=694270 RepID=A0A395SYM9_9HYPO|nr:hypothetical protein FLONG3_4333 [Fusarium longipes]